MKELMVRRGMEKDGVHVHHSYDALHQSMQRRADDAPLLKMLVVLAHWWCAVKDL